MDYSIEDEEILKEFDVHIVGNRKDDNKNFLLFSFNKDQKTLENTKCLNSIKMNEDKSAFEIKMNFDTDSKSIEMDRCENPIRVGNHRQRKQNKPRYLMKNLILKSTQLPSTSLEYGVTYIDYNLKNIYLKQISSIHDFQTDFSQVDKIPEKDIRHRSYKNNRNVIVHETVSEEELNDNLKNSDNWIKMDIIKKDFKEIKCSTEDYIVTSQKKKLNKREIVSKIESNMLGTSLPKFPRKYVAQKIKKILLKSIVISNEYLFKKILLNVEEDIKVRIIQKFANLVQGNWVIKSEILYPKCQLLVQGKEDKKLAFIHNLVCWVFTQQFSIKRSEILSKVKVPYSDLLDALKLISTFNSTTRTWDFMYPADNEFIKKYSTVHQHQELIWEARKNQFYQLLHSGAID